MSVHDRDIMFGHSPGYKFEFCNTSGRSRSLPVISFQRTANDNWTSRPFIYDHIYKKRMSVVGKDFKAFLLLPNTKLVHPPPVISFRETDVVNRTEFIHNYIYEKQYPRLSDLVILTYLVPSSPNTLGLLIGKGKVPPSLLNPTVLTFEFTLRKHLRARRLIIRHRGPFVRTTKVILHSSTATSRYVLRHDIHHHNKVVSKY